MRFAKIEDAIKDIQRGQFIVVVDDENRENEGDLVVAAEKATPSKLNYMIRNARGIMCVAITAQRLHELDIPLMVEKNTDYFGTPFAVSVDAKNGITTGVSVSDRIETIKNLAILTSLRKNLFRNQAKTLLEGNL